MPQKFLLWRKIDALALRVASGGLIVSRSSRSTVKRSTEGIILIDTFRSLTPSNDEKNIGNG
jgi:hypothetical protein